MPSDQRLRTPRLWYACAVCLLLIGCTVNTPQLPPLDRGDVILAFGDSLTQGNGAGGNQSYPAVLSQLSGHTVINAGVSGEVSAQGLQRLPDLLDSHRPALLLLCHGGNDMLRRINTATTRSNLESMIRAASERDIPVVLIGVPKPGLFFLESADFYGEIADKFGLVYEGEIVAAVESDNALKSDQIHPNAAGYRQIAEALYQLLGKSGALPQH